MIHDGEVKGLPLIQYRDTKSNIEALSAETGMVAFATDTNRLGYRESSGWTWITAASTSGVSWSNIAVVAGEGGNYDSIQDAIDATAAGCCVFVMPGTYVEDIEMKEGVSVVGLDRENVIIQGPGTDGSYCVTYTGSVGSTLLANVRLVNTGSLVSVLYGVLHASTGTNYIHNVRSYLTNSGIANNARGFAMTAAGTLIVDRSESDGTGVTVAGGYVNNAGGTLSLRHSVMGLVANVSGSLRVSFTSYSTSSGTITHDDHASILASVVDSSSNLVLPGKVSLASVAGVATNGYLWRDSTQKAIQTYTNSIEQTLAGCIFTQTADRTIADSTSETTMFGSGVGTLTLPANFFVAGKTIHVELRGHNSTIPAAGNLTFKVYLGATQIIASATNAAGNGYTNRGWGIVFDITCRSTGASGTVFGQGLVTRSSSSSTLDGWDMVATSATTINTTGSLAINVTAQWSTADAGNTITCTNATVSVLN